MKKYFFLTLLVLMSVFPLVTFAQNNGAATASNCSSSDGFVSLSCVPGFASAEQAGGLASFFQIVYNMCVGIAALLAVIQIVRAGVMYMGSDNIGNKSRARELIWASVIGLVLVLSPVLVLNLINNGINNFQELTTDSTSLNIKSTPSTPAAPVAPNTSTVLDQSSVAAPGNHFTITGNTCSSNLASSCGQAMQQCTSSGALFNQAEGDYTCVNKTTGAQEQINGTGTSGVCPSTDYAQVTCSQGQTDPIGF